MTQPQPGPNGSAPSIGMGEIRVARDGGTLRTVLGSCVGLVLLDRRRRFAGVAHIVLPDSRGQGQPPGKYADTAVPETLRLLRDLAGGETLHITAKIAGGAKMLPFQQGQTIGEQNVSAVERLLAAEGIAVVGRCCGGEHGRRLVVDVATGAVTVETVGGGAETVL